MGLLTTGAACDTGGRTTLIERRQGIWRCATTDGGSMCPPAREAVLRGRRGVVWPPQWNNRRVDNFPSSHGTSQRTRSARAQFLRIRNVMAKRKRIEIPFLLGEAVKSGRAVLFLGAGASKECKNDKGERPPDADGLRDVISIKYMGKRMSNRTVM